MEAPVLKLTDFHVPFELFLMLVRLGLERCLHKIRDPLRLRQPQYKKKRTQEVRRYKKGLPSSLSEGLDRKRRPPIREDHKRRLMSSTASTEPVTKRGRRTEQNFGHIPGGGSRPGPEEERPLQSSRIQQGKSSPSQEQRRNYQESRFPIFRKNSTSPGGTIPVQKRPIQKTKPVPLQTASAVPTRSPGA
ncbi:uncharacterized protein TNCV_517111 [Trichonephila clavipes]|nr:uncharacterized protein TNCV_517111 [Trichonephila clavipes]